MPVARIDLAALSHNLSVIRGYLSSPTGVLAAVKANAYGHGALAVAKHLSQEGVRWFGVATPEEALELREGGIAENILLFSPAYGGLEGLIERQVALTVVDAFSLEAVRQAAQQAGLEARVHLKVDTGMGRLGLAPKEAAALALEAARTRKVTLEGVWTHFSCADDEASVATEAQVGAFTELVDALARQGLEVPIRHAANSAGIFAYKQAHVELVRPGIALYGYHSSPYIAGLEPRLKPVMTLTAPVTFVKRVGAGTGISYSGLWRAERETTVATVRIGYADGYPRVLSNRAQVLVAGELRPVLGRVCMDQLMVDVSDLGVQVGDRVTLFGPKGPTAEDLGVLAGTISYEILTSVGARVRRVYEG